MKKTMWILAFLMISVASWHQPLPAETIYGAGVVTFDIRDLPNFSKLVVNGSVQVYFGDIDEELVKVQAEQNLISYIYTKVENDTLHIDLNKDIKPTKQIMVYLAVKELTEITTTGTVLVSNEAPLKVDHLTINASGISQVTLPQLFCDNLTIDIDGSSTVYLKGSSKNQHVTMKGATVYKALGLITDETTISITGAGKAWVSAKDKLNLTLSGAAHLSYQGEPDIQKSISGVGRLEKLQSNFQN
jgi:Putative auto-transporter adhesin, head GIN domain